MIHALVPYYNYIEGVAEIQKALSKSDTKIKLTISNDSHDLMLNNQENWVLGPKSGAVNNWNYLLDLAECEHLVLIHQDEQLVPVKGLDELSLDRDTVYISDLIILSHGKKIRLSGRLRCFLMNYFPKLIYIVNFIGPTATLIFPQSNERFNTDLRWLVDVEFYFRLRARYRFKYNPNFVVLSKTTISQSITNSGELGNTNTLQREELRKLNLKFGKLYYILLKCAWHMYRLIKTSSRF